MYKYFLNRVFYWGASEASDTIKCNEWKLEV